MNNKTNGTKNCRGCNTLCWERDLRDGLCINCLYKELKAKRKAEQKSLFSK